MLIFLDYECTWAGQAETCPKNDIEEILRKKLIHSQGRCLFALTASSRDNRSKMTSEQKGNFAASLIQNVNEICEKKRYKFDSIGWSSNKTVVTVWGKLRKFKTLSKRYAKKPRLDVNYKFDDRNGPSESLLQLVENFRSSDVIKGEMVNENNAFPKLSSFGQEQEAVTDDRQDHQIQTVDDTKPISTCFGNPMVPEDVQRILFKSREQETWS